MRRPINWLIVLLMLVGLLHSALVRADTPSSRKLISECWYERRTDKGKMGYLHQATYLVEVDGRKIYRSEQRDLLKYLRSGDPYTAEDSQYCVETEDGQVLELGYKTALGKNQFLIVRGKPKGDVLLLEVLDQQGLKTIFEQTVPWDKRAIGLAAQDRLLAGKELKPGQIIAFHYFQTSMNRVIPSTFTVIGSQQITIGGELRPVIAIRQSYPKDIYFDPSDLFIDPQSRELLRTQEESSGFGVLIQDKVTQSQALAEFTPEVKDVESPILINKPIKPFRRGGPKELIIKVSHDTDDDIATLFVPDGRQEVIKAMGKTVELRLRTKPQVNKDEPTPDDPKPPQEFLASNFYIRSDAAEVIALAKKAVGDETDPRIRMRLIRNWVRRNVKGGYEVPFATADEVARTLEGDCTEMGVLSAAMGRALGIPTRICFGLVYDNDNPGFGGHLWTEAYVKGHWEVFDATGVVHMLGAAYLKVGHYSLHGVINPDELTPVRRAFAGKMHVELVENR